jgi:hypothetical protein
MERVLDDQLIKLGSAGDIKNIRGVAHGRLSRVKIEAFTGL